MDPAADLQIPGQGMTFGTLEAAQALGDHEALVARGRRVLRVRLSRLEQIAALTASVQSPESPIPFRAKPCMIGA